MIRSKIIKKVYHKMKKKIELPQILIEQLNKSNSGKGRRAVSSLGNRSKTNAILKNEEYCFDKGVRHIKDNLLKNLLIQDQIKQLYVNKVKEREEIKQKNMNNIIEKSIQEKLNKEIKHEEANNLRKNQLNQNHFKLLNDQIKDKKKK